MASTSVWTLNQSITGFNATLTPGSPTTSGHISISGAGFFTVEVQVSVVFVAAPAGRVVLEVYGSADGGTTVDTIPFLVLYAEPVPGATRILSFTVSSRSWIKVVATSRDSTNNVAVSALYSGMQIS